MKSDRIACNRFIRNKGTGEFLRNDGSWTNNLGEARRFGNAMTLLECCEVHGLKVGIQVLMKPCLYGVPEVIVDLF